MPEIAVETSGVGAVLRESVLECAALSIPRPGRELNEDRYVFASPGHPDAERAGVGYVFGLADGVSTGGRGGFAAQAVAEAILALLCEDRARSLRPDLLELKLYEANERVRAGIGGQSTATAIWIWEEQGGRLLAGWAHVGDSRLYHRSGGRWNVVTSDHSLGRGLARSIGGAEGLIVEHGRLELKADDWLVIASDGVWKHACPVAGRVIDGCKATAEAVRLLIGQARVNGSQDDATAVVIRVVLDGAHFER
jgi:serine/threonine protein phosphatase PrpC